KMKRHGFHLDMTPLVDVGFLLLTFFMLTASFKKQTDEMVDVSLPKSEADTTKMPDADVAILNIGVRPETGDTVLQFSVLNEKDKDPIFKALGEGLTPEAIAKKVKDGFALSELDRLIHQARLQNSRMRYAITAGNESYGRDGRVEFAHT